METFNQSKSFWSRDINDIFPLFVPLNYIYWDGGNLTSYASVFIDEPHTINSIYTKFSMSILPYNARISGPTSLGPTACVIVAPFHHQVVFLFCGLGGTCFC